MKLFFDITKKNKLLVILFCFCSIIFLLSFNVLYKYFNGSKQRINLMSSIMESTDPKYKNIHNLYDNINNELFGELYSSKHNVTRLLNFNKYLNKNFNFYEYNHNLDVKISKENFNGSSDFFISNNIDNFQKDDFVLLKAMNVSININEIHNLTIDEGRFFDLNDYKLSENTSIILGNEYKNLYKLNDKIEFEFLGKHFTGEVVGFLKKESLFFTHYYPNKIDKYKCDMLSLDNYFVIPSFNLDEISDIVDDNNQIFEFKFLLDKNNGHIFSSQNSDELNDKIHSYDDKELSNSYNLGANDVEIIEEIKNDIIYYYCGFFVIFINLILYVYLLHKLLFNLYFQFKFIFKDIFNYTCNIVLLCIVFSRIVLFNFKVNLFIEVTTYLFIFILCIIINIVFITKICDIKKYNQQNS